ncbi:MAG TPA: DUF4331 domain-containing protein [Gaiellaceae bacterium]|jgi:hypothetical protein
MKKKSIAFFGAALAAVGAAVGLAVAHGPSGAKASSHREAPLISEDPTADNTDLYAWRADVPQPMLNIVSNWIPGEDPAAGPNYYRFSSTARYNIYVDQNGNGKPDITYRFRFQNPAAPTDSFLGTTDQTYQVTRIEDGKGERMVGTCKTPPANIGPRTTPNYSALASNAICTLSDGTKVFAGQRDDAFFGDIGDIFDLLAIRSGTGANGGGKDFFAGYAVHSIALQIPVSQVDTKSHVIGLWSSTDRRKISIDGNTLGPWVQVSRLGNPLFNEVIVPTALKDQWNSDTPAEDAKYAKFVRNPILAHFLNLLYPQFGPFQETNRNDLVQVLLTGVPGLNNTGSTLADELRINLSIPPTAADKVSRLGVLGGDLAGYPNGRRLEDDVIDIDERAVGGALIGHSLPLGDGVDANDVPNLGSFPYEPDPQAGADNTKGQQKP